MADGGLSNRYALEYLYDEIQKVLDHFSKKRNDVHIFDSIRSLHQNSCLTLTSLSFICILLVIISIEYVLHRNIISLCNIIVIFILMSISFYANEYNYKISEIELFDKIRKVQKQLKDYISKSEHWNEDVFPNIYSPTAPCITLQWTIRDGKVLNLPWSLLVENDLILMRPGQESPALCRPIDKTANISILKRYEIFNKNDRGFPASNDFSTPRLRDPLECQKFILLETPYLDNLSLALDLFHHKDITYDNKLRQLLIMQFIEYYLVLLIIFVTVLIQWLYRVFLNDLLPIRGFYEMFLLQNARIVTPLLPIVFPIFWIVSNVLGITRLKILFDAMLNSNKNMDHEIQIDKSLFTYHLSVKNVKLFWNLFTCKEENLLSRTANVLHVLANITSLCCVDKKGILSWPNTTTEKVLFLDKEEDLKKEPSPSSKVHSNFNQNNHMMDDSDNCKFEILDLTHTQLDSFSVRFDDRKWDTFLNNLKPIGLAILMNTCNAETQAHYYKFCTHVTCESTFSETLVPVANRRCLCTLSKEIGFRDEATTSFLLKHQLSSFRHLESDVVKRNNKFARTVRISSKLKFPFPHMAAVTFQDSSTGDTQMFSQGTADMILDFCVDYWNGDDVVPLTSANRKRILDFYYRYSLTSYCTTFSYKPIIKLFDKADDFSNQYLELPSEYRNLHKLLENKCMSKLRQGHSHSSESIVLDDVVNESVSNQYLNMQYNQVFLGIVTLQYKPFRDVIYLIELLEKACIRFIHFSKENELRSRVFGEKLGLESGWNCHISLVGDSNRRSSEFTDQFLSGKQTLMTSPTKPYLNK